MVGVENNHTGSPRVNLGRFKVAIKGTPTFLVRGIEQGVPSMGISWLVFKGVLSKFQAKRQSLRLIGNQNYKAHT